MAAVAQSNTMRLVAVVVTHNRLGQLRPTLRRLLKSDPAHLQAVVVVDNASTDDTANWLKTQNEDRLEVVTSPNNLGGAGGFELGMRHAMERFDPDWVVTMDDDARPMPNALEVFQEAPRPDDTAIAAAVYFPNGQICEMNRPSVNPFWNARLLFCSVVYGRDGYHIPHSAYEADTPCPIDLTSFVGLFLSRRIISEIGYPDPGLFVYGDDVIYTLNLRRRGLKILFDPALQFEHDFSTFQTSGSCVVRPLWKAYYFCRNRLLMYRSAAPLCFWILLPVLGLKWHAASRHYGADRPRYLLLLRQALRDAITGDTSLSHSQVLELAGGTSAIQDIPVVATEKD